HWQVDDRFNLAPRLSGGAVGPVADRRHRDDREPARRPDLWSYQPEDPAQMTDTAVKISDAAIRRRMLKEFWFYFSQNRGAVIGLVVFAILVLTAIFAPLLAPHDPTHQYRDALLVPPFWQEGGRAEFLLGTDAVGRDMLSRLIYGAQYSLFIGIVVVSIALVGGIIIGLVAGFFGGWVDTVIMRVMDVVLAFPSLLLALVLVAVLGP